MFAHAERSSADIVIVDLEDAVPLAEKAAARETLAESMSVFTNPTTRVYLRINADGTEKDADFAVAGKLPIAGIVVPKVEQPTDLEGVNHWLDWIPDTALARRVALVALIESAAGVAAAGRFASTKVPRLMALAFGAEDFRASMGVSATEGGPLLDFARASVAVAAAAAGLLAIDSPTFDFQHLEVVREETRRARALGFRAKLAIHPAQIATIHDVFAPTDEERTWARRVMEAYEAVVREGGGVTEVDGRMIDLPTIKRARDILEEA
jgi:citrate lyase subunit beta/citryl-CoA lyase